MQIDGFMFAPDGYERMFALPGSMNELVRWVRSKMKREHQWDGRTKVCTTKFASLADKAEDILLQRHPRGWPGLPHRHDFIELMYVYSGHIDQTVDGEGMVLEAGDFCLLNTRALHSFKAPGNTDILVSIGLERKMFDALFVPYIGGVSGASRLAADRFDCGCCSGNAVFFHPKKDSWTSLTMQRLLFEYYAAPQRNPFVVRMLVLLLIHDLLSCLPALETNGSSGYRNEERLRDVLLYIGSDPAKANVKTAAAKLRVTPSHLSRLVSRCTGMSFTELVRRQRFLEAKELLQETDYPVETILSMIGYSNRTYFYKQFRKRFYLTPGELRLQARQKFRH